MRIDSGKKRNISESIALPEVSDGVQYFFQPLVIGKVFKQNKKGYLEEFINTFRTQGVIQTLTPAQLAMKPEGQRTWQWRKLHLLSEPRLKLDDVIIIRKIRYRVMDMEDNSQYGVCSYDLQEDYSSEE
jgi:hypothetical protein